MNMDLIERHLLPPVVYHATLDEHWHSIHNRIEINRPNAKIHLDFNKGFYTTTNYIQAKERALFLQKTKKHPTSSALLQQHQGIIITFDLNLDLLYTVLKEDHKVYRRVDELWAKFIAGNRSRQTPKYQHSYKWTYGPMADGNAVIYACE